jgi:hypothetical protein
LSCANTFRGSWEHNGCKDIAAGYLEAFLQTGRSFWFYTYKGIAIIQKLDFAHKILPAGKVSPTQITPSGQLRFLGIDMSGFRSAFFKELGPKFPAMEKLSLFDYSWVHSSTGYKTVWDYSQVRTLSLGLGRTLRRFLTRVSPSDLPQLQCLRIAYRVHNNGHLQEYLTSFLGGIKNLRKLKIETDAFEEYLGLESLAATAGDSLEVFRLRTIGSCLDSEAKLISISNLKLLQLLFPKLKYVSLDLATKTTQVSLHCLSCQLFF